MSSNNYLDISNYTFEKDIGEGNFGKVKLGIFKPTGEEFAIKILNKNKIKIKMKNSIFKENEIITRFNHINVVYVFQILEDQKNYYIIMEYCKHGELFDYIVKHEKLSEEESSIFFYQLINGLEYIHSKGISHRDLKPENLLLAENKILKIIDFGLSHEYEEDELLKTKCGSPSYAAPEIICCPFYDGFKVDIWCCGIILYAMLCGYLPFEGENNNLLFQNILNCDPEFPEFLSELSKDIISQILNPDPETRITIEEIKRHKFYLEGKRLCKIDYDNIENNIIKKRNIFGKNKIKNNNMNNNNIDNNIKELNNENKLNDLEESNLSENSKDINKYIYTANNHIISTKEDNLLDSNSNDIIHTENINLNIKESKNDSISSNNFKKQIMEIGNKYNDKIDIINNKIQRILKTDANDNIKIQLRPFSSNKKNNTTNKNVVSLSNNSQSNTNTNIDINSKQNHLYPFFNLISESKDNNNLKKNTLLQCRNEKERVMSWINDLDACASLGIINMDGPAYIMGAKPRYYGNPPLESIPDLIPPQSTTTKDVYTNSKPSKKANVKEIITGIILASLALLGFKKLGGGKLLKNLNAKAKPHFQNLRTKIKNFKLSNVTNWFRKIGSNIKNSNFYGKIKNLFTKKP